MKKLALIAALILSLTCNASDDKVYISNTQDAHQVNTWFRVHLDNGDWADVSSVHGDDVGIFVYPSDITLITPPQAWEIHYEIIYRCSTCGCVMNTRQCQNEYCSANPNRLL